MKEPFCRPDFDYLRSVLLRQGRPGPVPPIEFLADVEFMEQAIGERFPIESLADLKSCGEAECNLACDLIIRFQEQLGYDYVPVLVEVPLASSYTGADDTGGGAKRYWQDQNRGPIGSWADFDAYRWPGPEDISYRALDYTGRHLPDGMKIIAACDGVFEWAKAMMGLETFSFALMDDPDLVAAVCQRVGELTANACRSIVSMSNVGALFVSDDMGYFTATLISPKHLRKYIFPWTKRIAEVAHGGGIPFLLHACGNVAAVMDDLIEDVGIDGKHSYEDKIKPVEKVMEAWGDRISVLGGVDMDVLARGSEQQVRDRVRQILDFCGPRGGYCLGSGNTAANYIPLNNFLAMLDEGRRWNREHSGI